MPEIKSHPCTARELGLDGLHDDKMYFAPRSDDSSGFVDIYRKKFVCIDEKDRWVRGNWNNISASTISVRLNRCRGKDYCKSDKEID